MSTKSIFLQIEHIMAIINLNNLDGIPLEYIKELDKLHTLFKNNLLLEELIEEEPLRNIVSEINEFCKNNTIIGFHYTRAIPEEIISQGLICRTGVEIRSVFMSKYSHLFTKEERVQILKVWDEYFGTKAQQGRDNFLFFNFTTYGLVCGGAEPLLQNYGGEQVYMPLKRLPFIGNKLKSIGKPLILKCVLNPTDIHTFYDYPWGVIAVSTYHRSINSDQDVHNDDQDGYQSVGVLPKNIEIIDAQPYINRRTRVNPNI